MKIKLFAGISLTVGVLPLAAAASENEAVRLEPVVSTATRTAKVVSDAPASVSVVTAKDIEARNVQRVDDALTNVPGVYVQSLGGGTPSAWANRITLRGIPGYYRTAVMVDGQVLNNAFSGGTNMSAIPIESIEQIEVVPGPFSALYGGSAMGGVVNIITKTPTKREVVASGGYGSNNTSRESLTYRDKLSERVGIAFNYDHSQSSGYVNDYVVKAASGAGGTPVTGWQRTTDTQGNVQYLVGDKGNKGWSQDNTGVKLYLDIDPTSRLTLDAAYHYHATEFIGFNPYLRDGAGNPVYSGNVSINDGGGKKMALTESLFLTGPNGEEAKRYGAAYDTRLWGGADLKLNLGYMDNDYWYVTPGTTATSQGGAGKLSDIPNTKLDLSAQLSLPLGARHLLVLGAFAEDADLRKKDYALADWKNRDGRGTVGYHADGQTRSYAFSVQDEYALSDRVTFYLGGRYDSWETSGVVEQFTAPVFSNNYSKRTKSAFSPKVAATYKPTQDTTLRAAVGKAFRAPNLSDMYSTWASGAKVYQSNPDLDPEKSTSWEIGAEHRFRTGTTLRATYYQSEVTNLIYSSDLSPTLNMKSNAAKAEVEGVELELRQRLPAGLTAFVNATFNDSQITENQAVPASVGKQVTYSPQRMANLGVEGKRGPWFGSVTGRYVGKVYATDTNMDTVNGVYNAYDPYFVVNAKLGYALNKAFSATFAVDNLTDRDYFQGAKMPGRTFFATLTYRY